MPSKLFNLLSGNSSPTVSQEIGSPSFWGQVEQMRRTIPNPQAEVQRLLSTGEMSQSEFEQISHVANQLMGKRTV